MRSINPRSAFTLVELAIVLVIIGLIVGGVLVGQDLIQAARLRGIITEFEQYKTSVFVFKNKYDGYPGDLIRNKASQYGFLNRISTDARGDGDGMIETDAPTWNLVHCGG